uniref:Uncharacterized protein n=1 Tax=Romanomermis culicivorax TaxID=13658 RepID=A0A915K884_ROMCU
MQRRFDVRSDCATGTKVVPWKVLPSPKGATFGEGSTFTKGANERCAFSNGAYEKWRDCQWRNWIYAIGKGAND